MANIMSQKNVRNKVHRNGFDLSFRNSFTAKVGELLPVMVKEVIPGDKFNINVSSFTRTQPVQTAAFTRLREYYDFYFVPNRLLWDKFPAFIAQTNNPTHAASLKASADVSKHPWIGSYELIEMLVTAYAAMLNQGQPNEDGTKRIPLFDNSNIGYFNPLGFNRLDGTLKLLSYLGYGDMYQTVHSYIDPLNTTGTGTITPPNLEAGDYDVALNPFPILAYQKIYQDYYRFQQWEKSAPFTCNLDYIMSASNAHLDIDALDNYRLNLSQEFQTSMLDLRYCNYKKDLFTGVLPSAQFGDTAIASPVLGDLVGSYGYLKSPSTGSGQTNFNEFFVSLDTSDSSGASNTAGISVFALRQAEFLQKWREITQSGNLDYREQLEKHWNVKTSRFQSDLCDYLGGSGSNININEVVNSNLTSVADNANIAGKGVGTSGAHISREFNEHGILMCIYHCEPILDWAAIGLDRLNSKVTADAYAIPEFDSLGMEELPMSDLLFTNFLYEEGELPTSVGTPVGDKYLYTTIGNSNLHEAIGYVPRYIEYKTSKDVINGSFNTTMKDWVSPLNKIDIVRRFYMRSFDSGDAIGDVYKDVVNSWSFKVSPAVVDPIFAVAADDSIDTDHLLVGAFFDCKVVRNLSTDGLPY